MPRIARRPPGCGADELRSAIERFLSGARKPALLEPGEELLPITADNFAIHHRNATLSVQAWDQKRNVVRRVAAIREETAGRLELQVERFARKEGRLFLVDLSRPAGHDFARRGARLVFRERLRIFLNREFPGWDLAELTTEPDLQRSLSAVYPRALLRKGRYAWAAIGAPPEADHSGVLSFGLIWLDHLRRRHEGRLTIEGLVLYLPEGRERSTCLRLAYIHPEAARCELFVYSEDGFVAHLDPRDAGNLDTRLEPCRRPAEHDDAPELAALLQLPEVESVRKQDGSLSLRVRGLEFAQASAGRLAFGLREHVAAGPHNLAEVRSLASNLAGWRAPSADREHPLYRVNPEAWLESQVRANLEQIDASLLPDPVYGQVPAFAGGERGVFDLLAVDRSGRLAVLELKASADLHLPLQALDYWMRVKWHLDRDEFSACGYFPGSALRAEAPRLLLISPALDFHPTTETILGFLSPAVDVERIGVGVEWRRRLEVMFRLSGAQRP
jgi:hypothetical protein